MNQVDYDKNKMSADSYGNLTEKKQTTSYRGHTIDKGIGQVKVWNSDGDFFGVFPSVCCAKEAIDSSDKS